MNRLDLIIDALQNCSAFQPKNYYEIDKALAAARELKDELYAKEMEQPTPKQSGNMSITVLRQALAQPEPVAWRNAAIRLGEDLYSVGPDGYYDMTAKQWLDWALSVVNTAQPEQKPIAYLCENAVGYKFFRKKKPDNVYKPIALYAAPVKRPWLGLTSEDWENTPTSDKQGCERDAEMLDWVEQTLKDKNDVI
jgi:hypothetical protein